MRSFDIKQLTDLISAAIEADVAAAQRRVAAVDAQAVPQRLVVRIARRGGGDLFVSGVRFADGDGYRIKAFSYVPDRAKAHVFGAACGVAVARQVAARGALGVMLQEVANA